MALCVFFFFSLSTFGHCTFAITYADALIYERFIMNFSTSTNCLPLRSSLLNIFHLFVECHRANEENNHNKLVNLFAQFKFDTLACAYILHTDTNNAMPLRDLNIPRQPLKDELDRTTTLLQP